MTVYKLDAARRQLQTAITLYFHDGDAVSIHTLTCAGTEIIRDIIKSESPDERTIEEIMLDCIKDEYKEEVRIKALRGPANFFKHANKDPKGSITFGPILTELFLYEATIGYQRLTGEAVPVFALFNIWLMLNNTDMFLFSDEQRRMIEENRITATSKQAFFTEYLPIMYKSKGTTSA